jgi:CDP-2,3-bis-(O-geranylgeranyl)-sn-glycerol synthase
MAATEAAVLALLLGANAAPVLAHHAVGGRWCRPLDGGRTLADGRPLLGSSKTLTGLLAALLVTPPLAQLLGLGWAVGLLIAGGAMLGDLLSSFVKRRLGLAPSAMALGLDQVPESLLPLLLCAPLLGLSWQAVTLLTLAFVVLELVLSRIAYRLGLRDQPY